MCEYHTTTVVFDVLVWDASLNFMSYATNVNQYVMIISKTMHIHAKNLTAFQLYKFIKLTCTINTRITYAYHLLNNIAKTVPVIKSHIVL